ncbi:PKD domain-containing protein [Halorubrum sp. Atlit-28R]|uniref:PKD domain-containing protein n=1 Tax=Halorubrum sp. Atlit-28R TaxID=2282129 RepID=UPI000EF18ED5|nr:PKD domain-containing protein [Halorubrum sp. Atlit-28R]RLM49977.1 PKD domain-containing protein [Halorubrum sp. Atlit-28R]
MNSETRSVLSVLFVVIVIMAGITVGTTPASAATGDLEIVDVEEQINGKTVNGIVPGQSVDVTVDYSLSGESSYTIYIYEDDITEISDEQLASKTVNNNDGTVEISVPGDEIDDAMSDDSDNKAELRAIVLNGAFRDDVESENVVKNRPSSNIFLQDVPDSIAEGTTGSVTLYGWSENSFADWELAESDTLVDNQIASGSAFVDNAGYYEKMVEFEADEYTGGFGDPPIDVLAKSTDSSSTSETFEISVPEPPEPPTADFSVDPNRQLNPGETAFFDPFDSTAPDGRIVEYNWDWDNDGIYEDTTTGGTGHAFDTESDQTVRLRVVDDNGLTDTVTKTVEMNQQPTADFEWDPESPTDPGDVFGAEVTFFGSYASDPDGSIDTYEWELRKQDGSLTKRPDGMTPIVDKLYVGTYEMTLTVTDTDGGTDSITKTFSVSDGAPPTASAGADTTTSVGEPVTFDASGSEDNVGISAYEWDVDDDGSYEKSGQFTEHTYQTTGTTTVTLRVTDEAGNTDTDTLQVTVEDTTSPDADAGGDKSTSLSNNVNLDAGGSSDNVGITSYDWDIDDDGEYERSGRGTAVGFQDPGTYAVTLRVTDEAGNTDTDTIQITVTDEAAPSADAGQSKSVATGESVRFDASGSSDNIGITAYSWDIDDDGSYEKSGQTISHAFESTGTKTVTLRVRDAAGNTATDSIAVTVADAEPPTADAGSDKTGSLGDSFTFDASGSSDNVGIDRYEWDLDGDGSYETTGKRVSKSYDEPGTTTVTVRVEDAAGNTATDTVEVAVEDTTDPTAVTGPDRTVVSGETVRLDGSDSLDNVGVVDYHWDVDGDGAYENTGAEVTTTYPTAGTATVTLQVRDAAGNTDTETVEITVEDEGDTTPPDADAGADTTATVGETVEFDGSASTDNSEIATYEWDLDADGTYEATGASVDHTFESAGNKSVTLLVTDAAGNTDTDTVTVQVEEAEEPAVTAEAGGPYSVTAFESVKLNASGSTASNTEIVATEWELLDEVGTIADDTYQPPDELAADQTIQVRLTVTAADGATDTDTAEISVEQPSEGPTANSGGPYSVSEGGAVGLNASGSTAPDGEIVQTAWKVINGQGTITDGTYQAPSGLSEDITATVQLTVTTSNNQSDTDTSTISVQADSTPDPSTNPVLSSLSIADNGTTATITEGDDEPVDLRIKNTGDTQETFTIAATLGDQTATKTATVDAGAVKQTTFSNVTTKLDPGTYTVTVRDQAGTATLTGELTVTDAEPPTEGATVTSTSDALTIPAGSSNTVAVAVNNIEDIGGYDLNLSLANEGTAQITDVTLNGDPSVENVSIAPGGQFATINAAAAKIDGTDPTVVASVELTGTAVGNTSLEMTANTITDRGGDKYNITTNTAAAAITVQAGPGDITGNDEPATDPDNDDVYEDINGDGSVDIFDVQALYNNLETDTVQGNPAFDINGDGSVDIFDVQAMFIDL